MNKQIETTNQLEKVVSEMVKDIDKKLSIHKKYKTFKTKVSDRQYNINVISEDGFEMKKWVTGILPRDSLFYFVIDSWSLFLNELLSVSDIDALLWYPI